MPKELENPAVKGTLVIKPPPYIPIAIDPADLVSSVHQLLYARFPEWKQLADCNIQFLQLTEGKTNMSLKVINCRPGLSDEQIEEEAVILRIYGNGTELLTDRSREWKAHCILSHYNLAPPLLGRFDNGFMYRFITGRVCTPEDLRNERTWRGIARKLGQWHGLLPLAVVTPDGISKVATTSTQINTTDSIWTLAQKWVSALPITTCEETVRKETLQTELHRLMEELSNVHGIGNNTLVFGHCDLLSGNIIVHSHQGGAIGNEEVDLVTFIDYEYALPCPAAFDLSNHFSEWVGFECDYNLIPTRSTRRAFLREYVRSFREHSKARQENDLEEQVEKLVHDVDRFRGVPGLFWSLCAFVQAMNPQTKFDYKGYAESRLAEYWAWRATEAGTRTSLTEVLLRERRWAQES